MSATMEIVVGEGQGRKTYPGTASAQFSTELPAYRGGVTMTIQSGKPPEPNRMPRITVDPNIRGGLPCVGGTWPITSILDSLAHGMTNEQVLQYCKGLTLVDIRLALRAASVVLWDAAIDWAEYDLPGMLAVRDEINLWQGLSAEAWNQIDNSESL